MPRQKQNKKKVVIGLTGSFGSGKSTVAEIFKSYGAFVIDADRIAHSSIKKSAKTYRKIIKVFGVSILNNRKEIDRGKLGKIVFNRQNLLKKLNKIIHPEVIRIIKTGIRKKKGGMIILDVPLLLEAGLAKIAPQLIVVTISRDKQIQRLLKKTYLSKTEILKRIKTQIPLRQKSRSADFIIDNSSSIRKTRKQVVEIRRKLWKN
ncbi:MAG: dephospho-CoA kinase [Candidatus Omnitrophica bacterium]|nr:dephospho-CoA kinase [Candidatus Omnitrophota bacterium]